jgi:hypothetical protein
MPSVKLSPVFNDAQLDNTGLPLSGGLVYWYIAGTTTSIAVYSENTGSTPQTNPVVLNTRGEPTLPIWLAVNTNYKAVLTDSIGNVIRQIDNISGINDTATPTISEWVLNPGTATYISATSFSVVGDQTAIFTAQRRVKATVSGGQSYSTISSSSFALGVTTVVVVNDSVVLDSGLSAIYYGFLDPSHPSFDSTGINAATKSAFQNQSFTAWTTAGTSTAYTLTPTPAITSYSANQRFRVKFNAASGAAPTLQVSGVASPPLLKQYDATGAKVTAITTLNQLSDVEFDGTDWVIMDPIISSVLPGTIVTFAGSATPSGYLSCPTVVTNISRTTYAALFSAIGVLWGAGDGSTTFGMPYFPADYSMVQGGTVGSSTAGAVIAHTHTVNGDNGGAGGAGGDSGRSTGTLRTPITNSTGGAANYAAGQRVQFLVKY